MCCAAEWCRSHLSYLYLHVTLVAFLMSCYYTNRVDNCLTVYARTSAAALNRAYLSETHLRLDDQGVASSRGRGALARAL